MIGKSNLQNTADQIVLGSSLNDRASANEEGAGNNSNNNLGNSSAKNQAKIQKDMDKLMR